MQLLQRHAGKLFVIWTLVIAGLCGMPGKDIPHISFLEFFAFDKWVHATLFFLLFFLGKQWLRSSGRQSGKTVFVLFCFCVFYGGLLEILQGLIFIERSADGADFVANTIGVAISALIKWYRD